MSRFLDILYRNGSPMKKTNIQMSLRLTYPRFKEYLAWLLEHQLVEEIQDEDAKVRENRADAEGNRLVPQAGRLVERYDRRS